MRITETQFVDLLRRQADQHGAKRKRADFGLRRGIGDDCAVIAQSAKTDLLVTTDLFLEDVHFRSRWMPPRAVGHKTLARGLSDIAAMGGTPRYAFLSLGLPPRLQTSWVNDFLGGFFKLATEAGVVLVGGDTGRSQSGFVADIILAGEAPRGRAILRRGAQEGDEIWVTGRLGVAAAGLAVLEHGSASERKQKSYAEAIEAFLYPQPRLRIGKFLRERKRASAMIDISDGLSIDLYRLCKESGVGARVLEEWIPKAESIPAAGRSKTSQSLRTPAWNALHGGEDLELLFTVPPGRARALPRSIGGVRLTRIGYVMPGSATKQRKQGTSLLLVREGREAPMPVLGFQHF